MKATYKTIEDHLKLAMEVARKVEYKHRLGCVIVKKNRVVSIGYNKPYKTHPKSNNKFKNIHAELDAMLGVDYRILEDAIVFVARQHRDGTPAIAKPCIHCMELLNKANIQVVFWTTAMNNNTWYDGLRIK